jgi:transcriptional regulator with XRE-family HTH domain
MAEGLSLGQALRALRRDKGLTEVELAERVGITQTSIWRYETDKRLPPTQLLEKIAEALGSSNRVRRELVDQLHSAQTQLQSVRAIAQRGLGRRQGEIARIEARATEIRSFQAAVVPGLLQIPDYARRIFEEAQDVGFAPQTQDVARALAVRLDRQTVLHDMSKRFRFVLTEAVLRWPRGDTQEMLAQLDRLQAVSELRNVDLAILPLDVRPPLSPINSFTIYDEDLVHVETLTEQVAIRDPSDVARYARAHEAFRGAALSGPDGRMLLESVAARLRQP